MSEFDLQVQKRAQEIIDTIESGDFNNKLAMFATLCAEMEFIIEEQAEQINKLKGK